MSTLLDLRTKLDQRISAAKVKGIYPDSFKNQALNDGGVQVTNFRKWPFLNHALKTLSQAAREYYEYPSRFKLGSIYRIMVDGVEYPMKEWEYFRDFRDAESDAQVSSQTGKQYFVYPAPLTDDLEIDVYGQLKWVKLSADEDESILPEDLDDAIVAIALSKLLKKERRTTEANNELTEQIGQGGNLANLYDQLVDSRPKGYIGTVQSSRWP